jgi:hypothetical protein
VPSATKFRFHRPTIETGPLEAELFAFGLAFACAVNMPGTDGTACAPAGIPPRQAAEANGSNAGQKASIAATAPNFAQLDS